MAEGDGFEPPVPGESGFDFAREVRGRLFAGAEWIRTFSSALDRRRFRGFVRVGTDLPAHRSSEQLPASAQHLLKSISAVSMPMPTTRASRRTIAWGPRSGASSNRCRRASSICLIWPITKSSRATSRSSSAATFGGSGEPSGVCRAARCSAALGSRSENQRPRQTNLYWHTRDWAGAQIIFERLHARQGFSRGFGRRSLVGVFDDTPEPHIAVAHDDVYKGRIELALA